MYCTFESAALHFMKPHGALKFIYNRYKQSIIVFFTRTLNDVINLYRFFVIENFVEKQKKVKERFL